MIVEVRLRYVTFEFSDAQGLRLSPIDHHANRGCFMSYEAKEVSDPEGALCPGALSILWDSVKCGSSSFRPSHCRPCIWRLLRVLFGTLGDGGSRDQWVCQGQGPESGGSGLSGSFLYPHYTQQRHRRILRPCLFVGLMSVTRTRRTATKQTPSLVPTLQISVHYWPPLNVPMGASNLGLNISAVIICVVKYLNVRVPTCVYPCYPHLTALHLSSLVLRIQLV